MKTIEMVMPVVLLAVLAQFTSAGYLGGAGSGGYGGGHASSFVHQEGPVVGPAHAVAVDEGHGGYGGGYGGYGGGYGGGDHGASHHVDYVAYPKYDFAYGVTDHHTGDSKAQKESRDGDHVVGEYTLKEPGGNVRTVKYVADDKGGFFAHVINQGGNDHSGGTYGGHGGYGGGHGGYGGGHGGYGGGHAHSYAHNHGPVVGPHHKVAVHGEYGGHGGY